MFRAFATRRFQCRGSVQHLSSLLQPNNTLRFEYPSNKTGLICGKQGTTIQRIQHETGSRIQLIGNKTAMADGAGMSTAHIAGGDAKAAQAIILQMLNNSNNNSKRPTDAKSIPFQRCDELGLKIVYVDVMSLCYKFVDTQTFSIVSTKRKMQTFVESAREAGLHLVFCIHNKRDKLAQKKRLDRMLRLVETGECRVPAHMKEVFEDLCDKFGSDCMTSSTTKISDMIAYYAHLNHRNSNSSTHRDTAHDIVAILSTNYVYNTFVTADGKRVAFRQLSSFDVDDEGKLLFQSYSPPPIGHSAEQTLLPSSNPPSNSRSNDVQIQSLVETRSYLKGAPSPLVKLMGNPFISARPYRQVLYSKVFQSEQGVVEIDETFPIWNGRQAVMDMTKVLVDSKRKNLMMDENPKQAFLRCFPNEAKGIKPMTFVSQVNWDKHVHTCKAICVKLYTLMRAHDGHAVSFVDEMELAEAWEF